MSSLRELHHYPSLLARVNAGKPPNGCQQAVPLEEWSGGVGGVVEEEGVDGEDGVGGNVKGRPHSVCHLD